MIPGLVRGAHDGPPRKRSGKGWFVRDAMVVVVMALVVFVAFTQMAWFTIQRDVGDRVLVDIPEGATLREIGSILGESNVIRSPRKFVLTVRLLRLTERLQAGTYEFGPSVSELDVLMALRYGEIAGRRVTVPEGYRASQIAVLLESILDIDAAVFMELVHDPDLMISLGVTAPSLEGYLHPDTYHMKLDTSAREAIVAMVGETTRFLDLRKAARAESMGMSLHEVLTLASIIESEALFARERSRISAVYHNRLTHDWRLEADPTVRYALGNYRRKLYFKDLDVDSPFNTYRYAGLPPGPICSPGDACILAALYPLEGSGDFFFVANVDGTHTFSRTFAEHVKAKERIRAEREGDAGGFSLDTGDDG
ncbi:MAG: endolytic transglycosylase MltG [Candidatus Eisenbacteria bacterium]